MPFVDTRGAGGLIRAQPAYPHLSPHRPPRAGRHMSTPLPKGAPLVSVLEQYGDAGVRPIPAHAPGVVSARNLNKCARPGPVKPDWKEQ
jgi:hypothetical protein